MKSLFEVFLVVITILINHCSLQSNGLPSASILKAKEIAVPAAKKFLEVNLIPKYFNIDLSNDLQLEGVSLTCQNDIAAWLGELNRNFNNLPQAENWALQMIDAWGKPPEGILSGHLQAMGDFDECLGVRGQSSQTSPFRGHYCTNYLLLEGRNISKTENSSRIQDKRSIQNLMDIIQATAQTSGPLSPTIASCLPSSCSPPDVQIFLENMLKSSELANYMTPVTGECYTDEKPPFSTGSIAMIVILSLFGVFILVGSTVDILMRYDYLSFKRTDRSVRVLIAFSVPRNTEKLLSTDSPPSSMGCLHGIRFISAAWVVLGHTFYMHLLQPLWNFVDIVDIPKNNLFSLLILNGTVVVDTFLTLTGVLVAYSILKALDKSHGKLNVPLLYISRYIRLTPMYAILIGISATLFPYVSTGPKWVVVDMWATFCRRNWWKNLLYINNLPIYSDSQPESDDLICYGESWYLGVDMQLFFLSPLIIYPLWRWERIGQVILSLSTLISLAIPMVVTYTLDLLPTSLPFRAKGDFDHQGYMATWMRASPYMIGIWTGYFLYKTQRHFKIPKIIMVTCWCIAASSALSIIFGIRKYFDWTYEIPKVEGVIYSGFQHGVWGVFIGWVVFACSRGYGGWVNRFLCWKVFIPLGRLTFAIYLVSFHLQFLLHFNYRQPIYYSFYNAMNIYFSHMVMSCIVAFVCSVTMEVPFIEISKIFLDNDKISDQQRGQPFTNNSIQNEDYGASSSTIDSEVPQQAHNLKF